MATRPCRKRITGGGWGASTSSRGLEPAPRPKTKPSRRRRKGNPRKARVQPTAEAIPGDDAKAPSRRRRRARKQPKQRPVMLCSGPRSPAAWSGAGGPFYNGRCDGPSPTTYTPPTFVDEINSKPASTAGTFSWCVVLHDGVGLRWLTAATVPACVRDSNDRSNPRDPHCFLPFNDWSPSPNAYNPDISPTRFTHGSPLLYAKLEHGSFSHAVTSVASPGPKYFPNPDSPITTFRSAPRFTFGGGETRSQYVRSCMCTCSNPCCAPTTAAGCPPGNPATPPPVARRCLAPWCSVSPAHLPRLVEPHPRPGRAGPLIAVAAGPLPGAAPAPHGPRHADHHPGSPRRGVQGTQCRARRVPTYRRCGWDRCSSCHRTT